MAYSIGYVACKVVHARDGRRQLTIYDTWRLNLQIRQHDCFPADIADIAGLGDVVERAAGALGRPDILVNNAGGVEQLGTDRSVTDHRRGAMHQNQAVTALS